MILIKLAVFLIFLAEPICLHSEVPRGSLPNKTSTVNQFVPEIAWEYRELLCDALTESFGNCDLLSHSAAKVMQESAWDCTAYSRYAGGCSQFTRSTAKWMSRGECRDLGDFYPKIVEDPEWALPCMVRYDRFHFDRVDAISFHHIIAKLDSAYNGGLTWLKRDEKLCDMEASCDSLYWYGHVELYSSRADWAIKENRHYVDRINNRLVREYLNAGYGGVDTGE